MDLQQSCRLRRPGGAGEQGWRPKEHGKENEEGKGKGEREREGEGGRESTYTSTATQKRDSSATDTLPIVREVSNCYRQVFKKLFR